MQLPNYAIFPFQAHVDISLGDPVVDERNAEDDGVSRDGIAVLDNVPSLNNVEDDEDEVI